MPWLYRKEISTYEGYPVFVDRTWTFRMRFSCLNADVMVFNPILKYPRYLHRSSRVAGISTVVSHISGVAYGNEERL